METVVIETELLERILNYLANHEDKHDFREGWQSEQLKQDIKRVTEIIKTSEES